MSEAHFYNRRGEPIDHAEAQRLWSDRNYRLVAQDVVDNDADEPLSEVMTMWLAFDYTHGDNGAPLFFETFIIGGRWDGRHTRYPTENAARQGHVITVINLCAGQRPWFVRAEKSPL